MYIFMCCFSLKSSSSTSALMNEVGETHISSLVGFCWSFKNIIILIVFKYRANMCQLSSMHLSVDLFD